VAALIHLDSAAIRVSYHNAAPPLAFLVPAQHLGAERLQRGRGRLQRGHPQTDERASGSTPSGGASRGSGRQYGYVHAADVPRGVNDTIAVIFVLERNAERPVERQRLFEMPGKDDDLSQFRHADLSCHALLPAGHSPPGCR